MGLGLTMSKPRHQTNERLSFLFEGWYIADLEDEVSYWQSALDDPIEYDTSTEYAQEQIDIHNTLLVRAEAAFEEQRTDKVNYDDGTWV